jgi:hypothetical protein
MEALRANIAYVAGEVKRLIGLGDLAAADRRAMGMLAALELAPAEMREALAEDAPAEMGEALTEANLRIIFQNLLHEPRTLEAATLAKIEQVNRQMKRLVIKEETWKKLLERDFPGWGEYIDEETLDAWSEKPDRDWTVAKRKYELFRRFVKATETYRRAGAGAYFGRVFELEHRGEVDIHMWRTTFDPAVPRDNYFKRWNFFERTNLGLDEFEDEDGKRFLYRHYLEAEFSKPTQFTYRIFLGFYPETTESSARPSKHRNYVKTSESALWDMTLFTLEAGPLLVFQLEPHRPLRLWWCRSPRRKLVSCSLCGSDAGSACDMCGAPFCGQSCFVDKQHLC